MRSLEKLLETPAENADEQVIKRLAECSPFALRWLNRAPIYCDFLTERLHHAWTLNEMLDFLAKYNVQDEASLKHALRQLRQHVMLRVFARDLSGLGSLEEVMLSMSILAEVSIKHALLHLTIWQSAQYGKPISDSGVVQELIVIGMGKLGGYELNVSSDIDLIFAYEEDGKTNGEKSISNQDYFTRLCKKLIAAIDDVTEDGFVFRVDMRLRPFGSEGALVSCIDALEDYYQNHGREWERYAWIKGRVLTGSQAAIRKSLMPFVFRKYLDFGAFASMRDLKVQIQRDVNRKDMHDNIKLGRGGIREIEFIAQVFQLIRGGQDTSLQTRPTLAVLQLLMQKALLPATAVAELTEAYVFLRNLEHRLQYVEDQQTQELPKSEQARARIAYAMNCPDWIALLSTLNQHRSHVERHFNEVFHDPNAQQSSQLAMQEVWLGVIDDAEASARLSALGYADANETLRLLRALLSGTKYKQLSEQSRQRLDALMPMVIMQAAIQALPDNALKRLLDLIESVCRRASYLALLVEYPDALTILAKLASASPWLMQYLSQHPLLLDELLDTQNLYAAPDFSLMRTELTKRLAAAEGDIERQMDIMRHFKHAAVFRFAAKDIAGELPLEKLSDYLSELADLILNVSLEFVWPHVRGKHLEEPKFAVIGYGKLGGMELGYASDLDIIFLYDDDAPEASEVYARFAQRINNWFNSLTSAGLLYETDLQLRPDGNSGLLVSSVSAFKEYQQSKAWVWEHQALTRARFVAGDEKIGLAFDAIKNAVLTQSREINHLRTSVVDMRQKMRDAHPSETGFFDLKHDAGGIVDVEFIVQFLVLAYAHQHHQLCKNEGNIALLKIASQIGLISQENALNAANSYRQMRELQHVLRLQGDSSAKVVMSKVEDIKNSVITLWSKTMKVEL